MVKLSEVYKEMGIAFTFPIAIKDEAGNVTYCETSNGWLKREYDAAGNETYYEESNGFWSKRKYDSKGNETYYENSRGSKRETWRASKTCESKVVEVDGVKYQLKSL